MPYPRRIFNPGSPDSIIRVHPAEACFWMSAGEYGFLFSVHDLAEVPAPRGVATVRQQRRETGTPALVLSKYANPG